MAKEFFTAIIASGGFAGESFDINVGPAETDVIDVLLSAGSATFPSELQENAPINLISTGALTGSRELDISGIENDGRVFFLSVRNTDIAANNLTITATTDINGGGASLVVSLTRDFLFVHETGGSWRAYQQATPTTAVALFRGFIDSTDWAAGTANRVTVIRTGVPVAGEIGPHNLTLANSYIIQSYRDDNGNQINLGAEVDSTTGDITLRKTGLAPSIDVRIIVMGG